MELILRIYEFSPELIFSKRSGDFHTHFRLIMLLRCELNKENYWSKHLSNVW